MQSSRDRLAGGCVRSCEGRPRSGATALQGRPCPVGQDQASQARPGSWTWEGLARGAIYLAPSGSTSSVSRPWSCPFLFFWYMTMQPVLLDWHVRPADDDGTGEHGRRRRRQCIKDSFSRWGCGGEQARQWLPSPGPDSPLPPRTTYALTAWAGRPVGGPPAHRNASKRTAGAQWRRAPSRARGRARACVGTAGQTRRGAAARRTFPTDVV